MCEVAPLRITSDVTGHKDFRKLTTAMCLACWNAIGRFRNYPEELKQLRVFGALISGTEIYFLIVFPVVKTVTKAGQKIGYEHKYSNSCPIF